MISATSSSSRVFSVTPYAAEGGFRPGGLLLMLLALAGAGAALGLAAHFLGKLIYLILIYPLLIGVLLGAVGRRTARSGHVRSPLLGGLAGFLGGVFAMAVMHYAAYVELQRALQAEMPAEVQTLTDEQLEAIVATAGDPEQARQDLAVLRASRSFRQFMDFSAQQGVSIGSRRSRGINLGYAGTYIYWGIEVLIVGLMALYMMREATSAPYCAVCEAWKESRVLALVERSDAARRGVEGGDLALLAESGPSTQGWSNFALHGALCPNCKGAHSSLDLKLVETVPNQKSRPDTRTRAHARWPAAALGAIEALCEPAPAEAEEPAETDEPLDPDGPPTPDGA